MTTTALENPGLRRMLRPAKLAPSGARRVEAKAWRSSVPRVSENEISAVASVIGYDVSKTDLEAILGEWEGFVLTLLLSGPEEARGLVRIDDELRTALIEAQTVGRVMSANLTGRPGTPLDAALCDHVINAWMDGAAAAGDTTNAWKTIRIIKDARTAKVALDDGDYGITDVTIAMGGGSRVGLLRIMQPAGSTMSTAGSGGDGAATLPPGLLSLEAELEAVLYKTKVPLGWLRSMKPGSILEIPRRAIDNVQIESIDGKRIVRARLGQKNGKRAVRLLDDDAPDTAASAQPVPAGGGQQELAALPGAQPAALPDLPAPEPLGALPDLPEPAPMGALPDLPEPEPMGALPDLPEPAPIGALPDLPEPEPIGALPDLPEPEPIGALPDLPPLDVED